MRILIADDEYLVRASLTSMLEELNLPIASIGVAKNGQELAAMAGVFLPDLAFVDIRMPGLSGLEAIQTARTASPHTSWFILTGFPEFDYAQEAIRLGVSGYLLKPLNPEELKKTLDVFVEQDRKRKAAQNEQFERELAALLYGLTSIELEDQESLVVKSHFSAGIFYLDSYLPEKTKAERQLGFCRRIQSHIEQRLDYYNGIALIVLPSGELASVGAWRPLQNNQADQLVQEYFQAVEHEALVSNEIDLAITFLVSKECPTYQNLQEQLDRLQKLAGLRVICGIGRKLDISVLDYEAKKYGTFELCNLTLEVCRCYHNRNYLGYMKALQDLEKVFLYANISETSPKAKAMANFLNRSLSCQLTTGSNVKLWIQALQQHGEQLLKEISREEIRSTDIIAQLIAYVDENYMSDVGVGQMAERLNLTPNYLSTLFHKKTGTNFMSYLKRVRMLKARELLTDPNVQVQKVAEKVGYGSARHFARLFAEQFGYLPSEYRDQFKKPGR